MSKTNRILGLDLATISTGYSIFYNDKLHEHGTIQSPKAITDLYQRIDQKYNTISQLVKQYKITHILCEDVALINTVNKKYANSFNRKCAHDLLLLQGTILSIAIERDLHFFNLMPSEWRKLCGMYKEKMTRLELTRPYQKQLAIDMANKLFCLDLKENEDDEAEAIMIGSIGYQLIKQ